MTFTMQASALYRYDFLVTEGDRCDVYAYFRHLPGRRAATSPSIASRGRPRPTCSTSSPRWATTSASSSSSKKLSEGFTVVHYSETNSDDFSLGILPLGQKPFHPYQLKRRRQGHVRERARRGPPEPARLRRARSRSRATARRSSSRLSSTARRRSTCMLMRKARGRCLPAALLRVPAELGRSPHRR